MKKQEPGTFTIPADLDTAGERLGVLDQLHRATGWERAAIVAAYVRPQQGRRNDLATSPDSGGSLSIEAFAKLGFAGLRKADTVRLYVTRWLDTHEGIHPEPGATVILPDDEWPPTRTGTDGYDSERGAAATVARIVEKHGPKAVAEAVAKDIDVARAAADAIAERPDAGELSIKLVGAVNDGFHESLDRGEAKDREARRRSAITLDSYLLDASKALRAATAMLDGQAVSERTALAVASAVERLRHEVDLLEVAGNGPRAKDWDAELAKLAEDGA